MPTNPPQEYNVVNLYPSSLRNGFNSCNKKAGLVLLPFTLSVPQFEMILPVLEITESGGSAFSNFSNFLRKKGPPHHILCMSAYSAVFTSSLSNF